MILPEKVNQSQSRTETIDSRPSRFVHRFLSLRSKHSRTSEVKCYVSRASEDSSRANSFFALASIFARPESFGNACYAGYRFLAFGSLGSLANKTE